MAKIEAVLKIELNPHNPVPEIMQVIAVLLQNNPGQEEAILKGVTESIGMMQSRMKGADTGGK